jgi:hypothetical protein
MILRAPIFSLALGPQNLRAGSGYVNQAGTVVGSTAGWRVDWARVSLGPSRRRASIRGRRCSGCVPGRCVFNDGFNSTMVSSVLCDSFQSLLAMGLLQIWVASGVLGGGVHRRGCSTRSPGTILWFPFFLGASLHFWWDNCLCILYVRICICLSCCMFSLSTNTDAFYQKKIQENRHKLSSSSEPNI